MIQNDLKEVKAVDLLKEEAIKFAEWIRENRYKSNVSKGFWYNGVDKTSEELYEIFRKLKK